VVYNVGIIGCGVIGKKLSHYFNKNPSTSIKTVCDLDKSLAESLASEYGAKSTTNYKDLLQDRKLDIIYVGVPPGVHYSIIIDSLLSEKHIISEKPLSLNYELCRKLVAEKNKYLHLLTAVNLPFRFSSGVEMLKKELELKKIGDLQQIEFIIKYPKWPRQWQDVGWLKSKKEGGPLREVGTHYYFLLNELFGKITSVTGKVNFPDEFRCETGAKVILKIKKISCNLSLEIGKSEKDINDMIFHGSEGSLAFRDWSDLFYIDKEGVESQYKFDTVLTLNDMIVEFIKVLEKGNGNFKEVENNLVTFEDAAESQLVLDAIYNSNGKEIYL